MAEPYEPQPRRRRLRWLGILGLLAVALGVVVLVVILGITALHTDDVIEGPHVLGERSQPFPDAAAAPPEPVEDAAIVIPDAGAPDAAVTREPTRGPPRRGPARTLRKIKFSELRAIQRENRPLLNACYARVVRKRPHTQRTKVSIIVDLEDGGRISAVHVGGTRDPLLVSCVGRAVRGWSFPSDLRAQRVTFPVLFVSGAAS
jgi:hypothetical protein